MKPTPAVVKPVLACLFAALVSVGAYIAVPLPGNPVPIVLQNLFIMLTALLLGPAWGTVACLLYIGLGALGFQVFAGGKGGIAVLLGPTGGFLLGYVLATPLMGALCRIGKRAWWKYLAALVAGVVVIDLCGVVRLKYALDASWAKALALGLLPFLVGDALKVAVAVPLAARLVPMLEDLLEEGDGRD